MDWNKIRQFCVLIFFIAIGAGGRVVGQRGHTFNDGYTGANLDRVAFPIGGIGAGMVCLEGTGAISHVSVHHHPQMFNEPNIFGALYIKGIGARVLEGPVPGWKKFGLRDNARGGQGSDYGLARFGGASFRSRFPFGEVRIRDGGMPVSVSITGWSPFVPGDADNSSLPVGALEYRFVNTGNKPVKAVFSYSAANFIGVHVRHVAGGFALSQDPSKYNPPNQGDFAIFTDDPHTLVDHAWFPGGWWDPLRMAWKKISEGDTTEVPPAQYSGFGASLYVPFELKPGESKSIRVMMCWYIPFSELGSGDSIRSADDSIISYSEPVQPSPKYMPWYANRFKDIWEIARYWRENYGVLRRRTLQFSDALYSTTLPAEVMEAVTSNLSILKSTTVLRQYDGRFWGYEGSNDENGSCAGTCTHVYNYAQALSHLFPSLDRSIVETELNEGLDIHGHQNYREALPIRPTAHEDFAAADGQLGGIMRFYRAWRISGDSSWLLKLYPHAKLSTDYCISTWDPDRRGLVTEPHHNTYDIEFWGSDGMCTSLYLGALEAMVRMGTYLGEDVSGYESLLESGRRLMEKDLYNGQYFMQRIQWQGLHSRPDTAGFALAQRRLFEKEGPQYQYGTGCLSDGVIGCWLARLCGLPEPVDRAKIVSHLSAVYQYNFVRDLSGHSNPQRPTFALGKEGGLLLCSWPRGGEPSLPFVYSNEVWTGIEYEVASHLILEGKVKEGLSIVRTARSRYDGRVRNPYDEYECGHFYMRAMASYALLEALTGVRYDAVTRTLTVESRVGDFVSFLSTDTGWGTVSFVKGKVKVNVVEGKIDVGKIQVN